MFQMSWLNRPPPSVRPGPDASGGGSLLLDAGFELGVNLQYVLHDPGSDGLMQVPEQFHSEAFDLAPPFVILDKPPEPLVLLLIERMNRTPVALHAQFLALEMNVGIGFQILHQKHCEFRLLPAGIGGVQ